MTIIEYRGADFRACRQSDRFRDGDEYAGDGEDAVSNPGLRCSARMFLTVTVVKLFFNNPFAFIPEKV